MARHFATPEARRTNYDYRIKFDKENYRKYGIRLKRQEDSDIIAWLDEKKRNGESVSAITKAALIRYYEKSQ